jgi:hypothetical protein
MAMNSENTSNRDLYKGINEFKRGYQPRSNLVKDESGDLLANSQQYLEELILSVTECTEDE